MQIVLRQALVIIVALVFLGFSPLAKADLLHSNAKGFFDQGVEYAESGQYEEAKLAFTQAIQAETKVALAYTNRCWVNLQLANPQQAVQDCAEALRLQPDNPEAYLNRGVAQFRLGHYDAAIADQTHLIELGINDGRAYFNRGLALSMVGQWQQAISDYDQALQRVSDNNDEIYSDIYTERGLAQVSLGNWA
ncbi:MAG TPA: tetratricopeptide repeat protein, partial [Coleofasciculaceae cyanobacterium]